MSKIPTVTIEQMREVDSTMINEIGVSILMMMENASRNIASLTRKLLGGTVQGKKIVILSGKGNNGGDGLGAARHLINFGAICKVFLSTEANKLSPDAKIQYDILQRIKAEVNEYGTFSETHLINNLGYADYIIDALVGYNLVDDPKEPIAHFIRFANKSDKPILAVDIPSGLDGDNGQPHTPTIRAKATITLALPKAGLLVEKAKEYVGELYVADLSVPALVYKKLGITIPDIFQHSEIVQLF